MVDRNSGEDMRPDADALLNTSEKKENGTGRLKVFLGAMAGVGKTYAMMEYAHQELRTGTDIVIGWIDTHDREETVRIAEGIPRIPPKKMEYQGHVFEEMDIDGILERHPQAVVVDELAHTNISGSRHKRRYLDVEEILAAGISVCTAVNIQHIESLNDVVAQITGISVHETVPDSFFKKADAIEVIDIAPEELTKRLKEGKIYKQEQAERAVKTFFRSGNISALREMALRFTAQRADEDMGTYMRANRITGPWQASGKVMVGISGSPFSSDLLRAAARLARGLHSEMMAVHIEEVNPRFPIGDQEKARIEQNLKLARELGGQTMAVSADNFAEEFLRIARQENVTAVVMGKTGHRRWSELFTGTAVDRVIRESGTINVYVIHNSKADAKALPGVIHTQVRDLFRKSQKIDLLKTLVISAFMFLLMDWLHSVLQPAEGALLLLIPVLFTAFWWGRIPSALSALAGVLCYDLYFVEPLYTIDILDIHNLWSFAVFLLVSFLIGGQTEKMQNETQKARWSERTMQSIHRFSYGLSDVKDPEKIAERLAKQVGESCRRKTFAILPSGHCVIGKIICCDGQEAEVREIGRDFFPAKERSVIRWVYTRGEPAGRTTDTLQASGYLYMPLNGRNQCYGVLAVCLEEAAMTSSERNLAEAWADLAGMALERIDLSKVERTAELLAKSEKLRTALFNSVSHELKTPLAGIMGSVSALLEEEDLYSAEDRKELLNNIQESAWRMNRLVTNLLDTARMESDMMDLKKDWYDAEDLVGSAIGKLKNILDPFQIITRIDPDLPMIKADGVLIEQVLVNLIDNAVKYAGKDKEIEIWAGIREGMIRFSVLDRGTAVPKEDLEKIFDKFYRVPQITKVSGTGLGLAICKGIVEAHNGRIYAEERDGGGMIFRFTLPLEVPERKEGITDEDIDRG